MAWNITGKLVIRKSGKEYINGTFRTGTDTEDINVPCKHPKALTLGKAVNNQEGKMARSMTVVAKLWHVHHSGILVSL